VLIPSNDKAANPMYFDGDGKHYLVYESKGEKVRFLIWADGIGPKSSLSVEKGLLFNHNNRVYVESKATFSASAIDSKSGVKHSFIAIDNQPFIPFKENLDVERTGEYSIKIYSTDNVGNTGDTVVYKIVAAPDITFKVDNIYFETASARITESSIENLKEMLEILKNYPELHVEIKAHADSRGSSEYNLELSQRRAQSVVNYLTSKGIEGYRLKAKGYGDTQPVNECVKGVKCPDSKLRENRRVEFRFYLPKK
jgi:outer membrane protein OmpA-like peptidoglycan-associated protein